MSEVRALYVDSLIAVGMGIHDGCRMSQPVADWIR